MKHKKINPNVDFYSASTYYSMGIDPSVFTVIFAMSRILGWTAHYIEQVQDNKIMRPKALYNGILNKQYISIEKRDLVVIWLFNRRCLFSLSLGYCCYAPSYGNLFSDVYTVRRFWIFTKNSL